MIILFLLIFLAVIASPASAAVSPPDFPSCLAPTGSLKVSYTSGTHGIPGDLGTYTGSDSVYQVVGSDRLIQCFCPASGTSGIQTNWWKVGDLSGGEIDDFVKLGWIYVPSGALWGLDDVAYLAKNVSFSCGGGESISTPSPATPAPTFSPPGAGGAPVCDSAKPAAPVLLSVTRSGATATLVWSKSENATHYSISYGLKPNEYTYGVANTGNVTSFTVQALDPDQTYYFAVTAVNNCMPSDLSTAPVGGAVLGAFAPTGNLITIFTLLGLGLSFLGLSVLTARRFRRGQ